MASTPEKSLNSWLTSISEQILDLIELAAEVEVQIGDSEEGEKLKHNGKSISDSLEDNYLRLRLWGDNINIDLCDLEIGVENTLYSTIIEIFSRIQARLDSTKTALETVIDCPDYTTAVLEDIDTTDLQADLDSLGLCTKQLNNLAQSINIEGAIKSEKGPYGELPKAVQKIKHDQTHSIQPPESSSLNVSENRSILELGDTKQSDVTMSKTRENRDKKLHYSIKPSSHRDTPHHTYYYPESKLRWSQDSGIETNENPFAPRSTESQRYDLRTFQAAYDSVLDKIRRLQDANDELDRMQKKDTEERRTYKKDYEEMIIKNKKLEEENENLKDRIERLEKREKEFRPDSSTTTIHSVRSRMTSPSGRIVSSEEDRTLKPPEVRTQGPGEKLLLSRSKERMSSSKLKDNDKKLKPRAENEEPEGKNSNYHKYPLQD